jgi:hypothetical protein
MTMPFDQSLIAIRPYHSPLAIRQSLPFSVVANSHANMQLQGEPPFAPTIRQSLFANRCRFPSWLIATPTSLPFDQSPIAIRYSLPFRSW